MTSGITNNKCTSLSDISLNICTGNANKQQSLGKLLHIRNCYRLFHQICTVYRRGFGATFSASLNKMHKDVKSFPSHKAHRPHRAKMISVSVALSQTPVYTARPRIWG